MSRCLLAIGPESVLLLRYNLQCKIRDTHK